MYEKISEGQYLIKLLASAINNSKIDYPQNDFSWISLFTLASFHNVANTAFYGLQKLPDTSAIPQDIYEQFYTVATKYTAMESLQQFEIRQIFQRFEQNHIFCIPLDGHILKNYYPRPDMRHISTLSLLIKDTDKNKIHLVLNSLGYTLVGTTEEKTTYLKDNNINLELKTSLLPERPQQNEYFKKIVEAVENEHNNSYIGALSPEDFYVYTIARLAHLYASGGAGIRSVMDIWVYLKRLSPTLDREYIDKQLNDLNLNLFAFYMEEFPKMWFENMQIDQTDNEIYEQMANHLFENYKAKNFEQYEAALRAETEKKLEESEYENINKDKIFAPLNIMKKEYPILEKMPFLLPIFWLVRLVTKKN